MNPRAAKFVSGTGILALVLVISAPLLAQVAGATLSGTVRSTAGAAVADARVTVKNVATGQFTETQTDSAGAYTVSNLTPGDYEVSVSASGFNSQAAKVTLGESGQNVNLALTPALSLQSLGFPASATQGNTLEQARLDKRSHMLKMHQRLGLITTVPLVATLLTGNLAKGHRNAIATSSTGRDVHVALGSLTAGLYFTTASFAIFAPKIPGTQTRGPIRLHKILAWIHGPGMVLTPILGAMAFSQLSKGERVHGIARAHAPVAIVTTAAYGAAILSVSIKF